MNMRNNNRRNVLTHARVKFSQSEASSLLRGGGGGRINREGPKISPEKTQTPLPKNSEMIFLIFSVHAIEYKEKSEN